MAGNEFGEEIYDDDREKRADDAVDFLSGRDNRRIYNGPEKNPSSPKRVTEVEVGERPEPLAPDEMPRGPGLNVIGRDPDDRSITRENGVTTMRHWLRKDRG